MAEGRRMLTRWELVDNIRTCAQSIDDNADSILGDERYFSDITVSFKITRSPDEVLQINVSRNFLPEKSIEDEVTYKELKKKKEAKHGKK